MADTKLDTLPERAQKVITALQACNMDDLEALAKIMMPRIIDCDERTEVSANHMAVMLLQDLQGRP